MCVTTITLLAHQRNYLSLIWSSTCKVRWKVYNWHIWLL